MDGKQARRTGSSSVLGMLFDHGVDSCVTAMNGCLMYKLFCIGTTNKNMLLCWVIAIFPFYFISLEAFYTGEMVFTEINGVDEGSVVILVCSIVAAIYGNEIYKTKVEVPYFGVC